MNDMYRLVDPLRSNFDFSAALEQTNISSPNQVTQQLATGPRIRRVSSLTSGAPTFGALSEPSQPNSNMAQSPAKASRTRGPSSQSQQQLPAGFTPIYTYPVQQHSQQQSLQPTQPAPQLQPQPLAYQAYDSQVHSGADDDDRRASTSTSLSSVPLISPEDLHRGEVGHQIPSAMSYMPMEGSVKSFLQDGGNPYAYRDYCNDPYDPSPPSASQPLPYVDYQDAKPVVPIGSDLSLVSDVGVPPNAHHLRQWTSASVELPIAQLDLREDSSSATKVKGEEGKRKRAISKNLSVSTIPQTLTTKPQMTQRSHSANETLAPTQDRAYRRLSSPVLSVRPNDTGDAHTFSDDDDDEEEEEEEKPSVIFTAEQSRRGSQGILYGSYPTPGFATMPSASTSASASTVPSVYASVPVTSSSSSGSTTHTPAADNQPVHPAPPPADTSHLVRAVPPDVEDSELGRPRRQKLRFGDDWYTPEWVRGDGAKKEGFCDLCQPGKWLQLKNSAFW